MNKLFCLTLIFIGVQFAGETGKLVGKIMDKNDSPLIGVNVILEGTPYGTAANVAGEYFIELEPGEYSIIYRYVGYIPVELHISLSKKPEIVNILLQILMYPFQGRSKD